MSEHEARAELAHLGLPQATHHAVKNFPGGIQAFAAAYGYNENTFQQKINPTLTHTSLSLKQFEDVLMGTRSPLILDAIGRLTNSAWIDLGSFESAGDLDVLNTINDLVQSVGRMTGALHASLADGEVDTKELARLENHLSQLTGCAAAVIELAKKYMRKVG